MNIVEVNHNWQSPLEYNNVPVMIVLHHAEASKCTVEDINAWHKNNGWSGIGYHFFVRKDGTIYRGRPENAKGAHCPEVNSNSLGICVEGSYMTETMPLAQKNAVIELGIYLKNKYKIKQVYGHKELKSTDCPGKNYPLEEIKQAILNKPQTKVNYCMEFQKFYNATTKTKAPLKENGVFGDSTNKAYETLGKLIRGEY